MPIVNKTKRTAAIFNRGSEVVKVYDHGVLAWQKSTSIPDYLCFTALEAGQFTLTIPAAVTPTYLSYVEWSKDGRTWNHTDNTSDAVTIDVQVASGEKVYWRGSGACTSSRTSTQANASTFASTAEFDVSGHIMSLLKGKGFADYENLTNYNTDGIYNYTFYGLFYGNQKVVNAADLVLPTFTSYHTRIFGNLFYGCSSLVSAPMLPNLVMSEYGYASMFRNTAIATAPALPATTLANSCYSAMFYNCVNLTSAPALPARTLVRYCYQFMFALCSSLTAAPDLLAPTLLEYCYDRMFQNCSHINHVKCLATDISTTSCLNGWLQGVSSTGTFIQADGVTWPRGASGIPTGWLAYDEGEQIPNDYTPCDYIYNSSTGGGGVDLGFKFRILDYSVEAKFKQDDISNGMVMGTKNSDSGAIWYYNYTSAGSFRVNVCNSSGWKYNINGFMPLDTNTHIIRYVGDADGCYQISDGTQSGIHDISTWAAEESTDNLFIFGRAASTNTYKGGIYYLWVKDNSTDEYICNLIPCSRNSDGAAGFWDTAQKQFFTSTYWTAHNDNE